MENYSMNPLKQNIKLKQYIGWFIAILFPFAAKAIMDITKIPLISALIYWVVCGIMLRLSFEKKLPYFNPQFRKIKKELLLLILATALCAYLYISGSNSIKVPAKELIFNAFLFALLNGSFEQLVWVNIFDLAGSKIKLNGYAAVFIYVCLIQVVFWNTFMPLPQSNTIVFIVSQVLIFVIPFIIYTKTKDITVWSIQHILYNLLSVFFANFGISTFLHI
jgi:hypothetical protein